MFHAFPDRVSGGFVGVDVFFVISGYLISGIILSGIRDHSFRFSVFYARRIKRIFPSLIVVLGSCLAIGWFLLLPKDYKALGEHIAAGAAFVSNLLLWSESGYFDKSAELKPLLHLWSLGIEEQFYIIWPLILYFGFRRRANLAGILVALLVGSFLLNVLLAADHLVAAFYSPLTRFWELLAGGLLAHFAQRNQDALGTSGCDNIRTMLSLAGLSLIALAVIGFNGRIRFPGAWALIPVIGSCLLIVAGPGALVNRRLLASRPLVFIGLISYPLYLWHWPLLVFARIYYSGTPPTAVRAGLLGLSFVLAYLTYRFIERPVRFAADSRWTAPRLLGVMAIVAMAGMGCAALNGLPQRLSDQVRSYLTYEYNFGIDARVGSCWLNEKSPADGYAANCVDLVPAELPLVVVWGDSHAARFFPGLREVEPHAFRLAQFTRDSCPPVLNFGYDNCARANDVIEQKIRVLRPDTVILFAVWNHYNGGDRADEFFSKLLATIRALTQAGVRHVIVMGPAPQWTNALPDNVALQFVKAGVHTVPSRTYFNFDADLFKTDANLRSRLAGLPGVTYFSALDAMCNAEGCLTTVNGRADGLTSWDYGHLTTPGAAYLARKLLDLQGNFGQLAR
jgi:peptidoglycan/LPS O-acetylase OafA/YrhL/lysophospholipase L1-like esterase